MSCSIGYRHDSDPTFLWLWCRQAAAAPIRPLAWEIPYATHEALIKGEKKKKRYLQHSLNASKEFILRKFLPLYTQKLYM